MIRRRLSVALLLALPAAGALPATAAAVAPGALPAAAPGAAPAAPADAKPLGSYTMSAQSSPFSILLYEDSVPIPATPQAEGHFSYSSTTLTNGPASRGLGSSLWPGPSVGDGFGTITSTALPGPLVTALGPAAQTYTVESNATFPAGPAHAEQQAPTMSGTGTTADANDKRSAATSTVAFPPDATMAGGSPMTSVSNSDNASISVKSTTTAAAQDISLVAGLISVKGLEAVATTTSDGRTSTATGTTKINALTVAGQPFTVDDNGLHGGPASGAPNPFGVLPQGNDGLKPLGITVNAPGLVKKSNGAKASAAGFAASVTIDTTQLNTYLAMVDPTPVVGVLPNGPPFNQIKQAAYALSTSAPKVTYVFGDVAATAASSEAFDFDFGSLALPPVTPVTTAPAVATKAAPASSAAPTSAVPAPSSAPVGGTGGSDGGAAGGSGAAAPVDAGALPAAAGLPAGTLGTQPAPTVAGGAPVEAAAPVAPAAVALALPAGGSVSGGLVLGALALAGGLGWGLRFLAGGLFAGAAGAGAGCSLGAPTRVPDLREA